MARGKDLEKYKKTLRNESGLQLRDESLELLLEAQQTHVDEIIPLWEHQRKAVKLALQQDCFALFFEQGTGKTATAINILRHKYFEHKRILNTLIVCPLIVCENWKREILAHSRIKHHQVVILSGTQEQRVMALHNGFRNKDSFIAITNYESLVNMKMLWKNLVSFRPDIIVFDESQRLKDREAQRTKAAMILADKASYRLILSGTPILNSPMDLWSQFRILDGGKTFGRNFFEFRHFYFYDANSERRDGYFKIKHYPDWRIRPGALEQIAKRIEGNSLRVLKEDCLDLPPFVRQTIRVGMTPEQTKAYHEMRTHLLTIVKDKTVTAQIALTKALRLLQITSGFIGHDDVQTGVVNELSFSDTPKLRALRELLEELTPHHKVLVWAVFKENYIQIKTLLDTLGIKFTEITGEISTENKYKAMDDFEQKPEVRVLLGNPGSGGVGINLPSASVAIYFSRTFSLEHSLQSEARNYRHGSNIHKKVTRIDLVCSDTIDEAVMESLYKKEKISDKILDDL